MGDNSDADDIILSTDKKKGKSRKEKTSSKPKMKKEDNFISMGVEGLKGFKWKPYFLLFMVFLILTCDVFNDSCLSKFSGAVDGNDPTTYGTILQGIFLVLFFIVIDYLCRFGYF